uniref:PARN like, ribonuclease domain containing 1 n=1 Tax=Eptatretus burgeri TaxID=7764 RepID=A0A8C4QCD5_EPTBU
MCEVNSENFERIFPEMCDVINRAEFIAMDTELSGLWKSKEAPFQASVFDTLPIRYEKLRKNVSAFTMMQIGLSMFVREDPSDIRYLAYTYTVYLAAPALPTLNSVFHCEASSLYFLSAHGFDFNKWLYDGVPYLTELQASELERQLDFRWDGLISMTVWQFMRSPCFAVAEWIGGAAIGDTILVEEAVIQLGAWDSFLHFALREMFPNVWTKATPNGQVLVWKVTEEQRRELMKDGKNLRTICLEFQGFTRVARLVSASGKPVVGHNCLLDLMHFFDKFFRPLPEKYEDFKEQLNDLLPCIYDTKHIALSMKKDLRCYNGDAAASLSGLHAAIQRKFKGKLLCPKIRHAPGHSRYVNGGQIHEAGYDAFLCGSVFLFLAHQLVSNDLCCRLVHTLTVQDMLRCLSPFTNCIKIPCSYLCLSGEDPPQAKPSQVIVIGQPPPSFFQLLCKIGPHMVQPQGQHRFIVTVHSKHRIKELMAAAMPNEGLFVESYSVWRHTRLSTAVLWLSGIVCTSSLFWLITSHFK